MIADALVIQAVSEPTEAVSHLRIPRTVCFPVYFANVAQHVETEIDRQRDSGLRLL